MAEIDPFAQMLDETAPGNGDIAVKETYFGGSEPVRDEVEGSYADPDAHVEHNVCYSWYHTYEAVFDALIGAGLRIEYLHEFPFSVAPFWKTMFRDDDGWWYLPGADGKRPARRPPVRLLDQGYGAGRWARDRRQDCPPRPAPRGPVEQRLRAAAAPGPTPTRPPPRLQPRHVGRARRHPHRVRRCTTSQGFLAGRDTLTEIERRELVPHVAGKSLLHLQCHFGLDTLTLARAGARVTGVDFSGEAVATARRLAGEAGLAARFIQSDVLTLDAVLDERFDVVYTSWGVLIWLSDLAALGGPDPPRPQARRTLLHRRVPPRGLRARRQRRERTIRPGYSYFHSPEPLCFDDDGDYADPTGEGRPHALLRVDSLDGRHRQQPDRRRPRDRVPARVPLHDRPHLAVPGHRTTTASNASAATRTTSRSRSRCSRAAEPARAPAPRAAPRAPRPAPRAPARNEYHRNRVEVAVKY